jgi:hypothetical protein
MKARIIVVTGFTLGLLALAFLALSSRLPNSPVALPKPNGYDDFMKGGLMLTSDPPALDDLETERLQSLVSQNAAALVVVRQGLQRPCRVPVEYSLAYASNHLADLNRCKRVVRALVAEGKLAERESRSGDAARSYVDAIRFGHECSRGALILDMLVGVACQSLGCQALQGLAGQLDATILRATIRQLEEIDARSELPRDISNQERIWSRRTFGLRGQVARLLMQRSLEQNERNALAKLQSQRTAANRLTVELAERAYELDKGVTSTNIADLVPAYLQRLPQPAGLPQR